MSVRLNINGKNVGFNSLIPISINKSIANIRDPESRNSGFTKTIVIPGGSVINKLFEFIFQVNVESGSFNPNIKTPAAYFVNEIRVFRGDMQLLQINKTYSGFQEVVEYECAIVGENGNLFLDIANKKLTDIDFSDLDHTFAYASGLFNPTLGEGYCYPYIDYGLNTIGVGGRVGKTWTFEHLKPAIFEREYVRRIFDDAGYSWEASGFFDSEYYRHIIIPDVNAGALQVPGGDIANNQFYARQSTFDNNNLSLSYNGVGQWVGSFSDVMPFDDDSSATYYDPGGVFDTTTHIFEPTANGTFKITAFGDVDIGVNGPAGTATIVGSYDISVRVQKSADGGGSWSSVGNFGIVNVNSNQTFPINYDLTAVLPPVYVTQPCIFRAALFVSNIKIVFLNGSAVPITTGTASMDVNYAGTFGAIAATANLPSGEMVVMNSTIPRDVTQLEFLTSIIRLENLYFEPDRDNPKKYIIEPRESFLTEDADDWSDKIDYSKPIKIKPMGELDVKRYIFTYKSDKDHFNKLYEEEFKEVYGTETIDVNSDFVRGEKKIEVSFAATPIAGSDDVNGVDIVAARLFSTNGDLSEVTPMKCVIRRLYWGGMIPCNTHTLVKAGYWDPVSSNYTQPSEVDYNVKSYPFAGHVDHPMNPTVDLCWDNPQKLYWIFPQQTYTNNHRYGARWSKFISEITDRDSKIVTAYVHLNEIDIYNFSFRRKVFFDGAYYFVNEIKDYDPQEDGSIPVEFLKLQTGPTFTPMSIGNINDVLGGGGSNQNNARTGLMNSMANYGPGTSIGYNNINNDPNALVIGNNNVIG